MKRNLAVYVACLAVVALAVQATNKTASLEKQLNRADDDNEDGSFYTVDVLLAAGGVVPPSNGQNDTGLSIRLTARDGTVSAWHRLYASQDSSYFGQRSYILPNSTRDLGVISSVGIRVDKAELAGSATPYYLCVHGTTSDNWNGCAYMQPPVGSKNGSDQQYPLRAADGKLI